MNISIPDEEEFPEVKRISSAAIQYQQSNNERRWRLSLLKDQFETLELHKLFNRYLQRISHGYFSQFLSLQIILVTAHLIVLLAAVESIQDVVADLILYSIVLAVSVILLIVTDTQVKEYPSLLKYLAGMAFLVTFFMNAFIPFYYRNKEPYGNLRPAYTTYLIISNYIFLNIHNDLVAFVVGLFVSIFHIVMLILVTYEDTDRLYRRIGSDSIYLICINCLGMFFRYMNEIVIRRSFLDRRSCVESTYQLEFEEEQRNLLMSSIIPQHIIAKVRKTLTEYIGHYAENNMIPKEKPFEDLYVEEHPNVTILFADIVNYTTMTTKLDVITLLDILNELFGRFDDASDNLKVLRIKFLGDCYYCVAGLPPDPAPNHAEACVDLGLKMISIIADIRERKSLNINMRIGIHSGKISCGIIGTIKWQYDIWSKDVDTANKMETEGMPGMVHITKETKELLKKTYNVRKTNKVVNGGRTYLIEPQTAETTPTEPPVPNGIAGRIFENHVSQEDKSDQNNNDGNQRKITIYEKRTSRSSTSRYPQGVRSFSLITTYNAQEGIELDHDSKREQRGRHTVPSTNERRVSGNPNLGIFQKQIRGNARISTDRRLTGNDKKRRTAFMNNNIKRYNERLEKTNKELEDTIEEMRLSKFEQWFQASDMYRILLVFKDLKSELDFVKMPDPLFKYYLIGEVLLLLLVFVLENLTLSRWSWPSWPFYTTVGVILFVFVPLSWTHFVWTKYIAKFENDLPTNRLIGVLYNTSKFITNNVLVRFAIYTVVYVLFCVCVLMEWIECYEINVAELSSSNTSRRNFLSLIMKDDLEETKAQCIIPWHMTETFALAIIMSFLFLRMYMWLKVLYAAVIAAIYSFCILEFSGEFYGDSQTFNYGLPPQVSHIMGVLFLTMTLHLVDRQTEYMNRIDHLWYKRLVEKEEQADSIHVVNNMLLKNILPIHVADLYLNVKRDYSSEEVYNENYADAAVMFASITDFSVEDMGPKFLKTMSAIISEFDLLLVKNTYGRPIEKIKIAKWTYMAACGLAPGQGDTENIRRDPADHVVISLLKFAACLMQKMETINREIQQEMKLRIGVSHGFIAAGVVGSKKPLYDIWGDPVNMASRMDTLGVVGRIQVLKETAEVIESFGYACDYREEIEVKGRDHLVSTYFVALDEDFQLVRRDRSD